MLFWKNQNAYPEIARRRILDDRVGWVHRRSENRWDKVLRYCVRFISHIFQLKESRLRIEFVEMAQENAIHM